MSSKIKAHVFLTLAAIIYGANYNIAKLIIPDYIGPFAAIVIRVISGAILFTIVHYLFIREKVQNKDFFMLGLCAVFGVALNQLMFFKGLSITSAINASVIMTITPIMVLVMSALIIKEKITRRKIIGIGCGAIGAILLIGGKDFSFSTAYFWGDIFILINASSFAVFLVLVKPLMKKYHPITVIKWTFLFGILIVVPFGYEELTQLTSEDLIPKVLWSMGFIVLGTTFLAYMFNSLALKLVSPTVVGTYIYLQPIIATIMAFVIGVGYLDVKTILLALLIFLGVYLVSK